MTLPLDQWQEVGRNESARYYLAEEGVIVVLPYEDMVDTETSARAAVKLQIDYWKGAGRPGASVVLVDPVGHQEAGARRVYQREIDPEWHTCVALVTSSFFGRAVASVFLGLARPPVPTTMFVDLDAALSWARQQNATRGMPPRG
ncbi:MAG: hypothetical protein O2930_13105 [Acidobacteria bacterium]|nr:hypothetical protein [Acidobacteriota bacterium]